VFATMIRPADRWCRVSISDPKRSQLTLLRTELDLDAPQPPRSSKDRVIQRHRRQRCANPTEDHRQRPVPDHSQIIDRVAPATLPATTDVISAPAFAAALPC
jgi:hypothetical protein